MKKIVLLFILFISLVSCVALFQHLTVEDVILMKKMVCIIGMENLANI